MSEKPQVKNSELDKSTEKKDQSNLEKNSTAEYTGKVLTLTGYGGYNKLKVLTENVSPPTNNEVIVRVESCGLNFAELMGRQGLYDRFPKPPCVMGFECSGEIISHGEQVQNLKIGDRVIVMQGHGAWREYLKVSEDHCFIMPDNMSFDEGASIPVNYLTAYFMLYDMGNLRPGKSVLVHMAAGGVGCAASQLCATVPNVTVFGTASAAKHDIIKNNGVTHPIDYRTSNYEEEIRKISPSGVDIVLDPFVGKDATIGFNLLKPLGKIIHFGAANMVSGETRSMLKVAKTWWQTANLNPLYLMKENKAVCGFHLGTLGEEITLLREAMTDILNLFREGKIKPMIHAKYSFEDIGIAMNEMHERKNIGKVLLTPSAITKIEVCWETI